MLAIQENVRWHLLLRLDSILSILKSYRRSGAGDSDPALPNLKFVEFKASLKYITEVGERVSSGLSTCPFSSEEICLSEVKTSEVDCRGRSPCGSAILPPTKFTSCDRRVVCQRSAS